MNNICNNECITSNDIKKLINQYKELNIKVH